MWLVCDCCWRLSATKPLIKPEAESPPLAAYDYIIASPATWLNYELLVIPNY